MLRGLRIHMLMTLALVLVTSASAFAQAYGRVTVVVTDEQGQALQGAKVVVTCKELDKYREETATNKKGKATVSFTDATKRYEFHFEYEDYRPVDMTIKPEIRGSITREVVLSKGQAVPAGEGAEGNVIFSPSEKVFNEGVGAIKAGDLATAKAKFLEALEKNDKMAAAHSALAGVYIEEKNYPAALESVNRYRELAPEDTNGLFMLYDVQMALGNQKEADAALKELKAADKGGDTVALIYNAGVTAVKAGNYTGAKARFMEALDLDPNLAAAMSALALIHYTEKSYQEALAWSEKHLQVEPGDTRSLRIRWESYDALGEAEKAKAAFKDLAAADPEVLAAELFNKGVGLFEAGNNADAIVQFQQALEADPNLARAHYQLGLCFIGTGQAADAKTHLEKFIEMSPDAPDAAVAKEMIASLK